MARSYDIKIALRLISEGLNELKDVANILQGLSGTSKAAARELKNLNVNIGGINSLKSAEQALAAVQARVSNLKDTKLDVGVQLDEIKFLEKTLLRIQSVGQNINNAGLFTTASTSLTALREVRNQLQGAVKEAEALNRPLSAISNVATSFNKVKKELRDVNKELQNAKSLGNAVDIKPKLQANTNKIITDLQKILAAKTNLGEDTKPIKIELANAQRILNQLSQIDKTADNISRDKIKIEAQGESDLNNTIKRVKELQKAIQDAQKNRNIKIIPELKANAGEIQKELASLEPKIRQLGQRGKIKLFDKASIGLQDAQKEISGFEKNLPRGILGFFAKIGSSAQLAGKQIGGIDGFLKASAGSFRLVGTAAFLVGGQFRTLGFAGAALGNLLQNFGPIFARLIPAFGSFTLILLPIAGLIAAIGAQALIGGAALAKIVEVGIKFNDEFDRTRNTVAALAAEFFTFTRNGKDVGEGLSDVQGSIAQFEAGSRVAAQELRALSIEALKTQFTTKELFSAFQATVTALGPLSPSLQSARQLTGQFARAASVAKIPAEQLGSAINQIVQGTGRSTNRLQQLFNKLRDSEGVALTAARIRELRAEGGDKLFNELTAALGRFTAKVGDAQSSTISGAFSNLRDLFELFSGDVTRGLTDNLAKGFNKIKDLFLTQTTFIDELGNKVTNTDFSAPVQKIIDVLSSLLERAGDDFLRLLTTIAEYLLSFGDYLENNYGTFLVIYEIVVSLVKQFALIVVDFLEIFGLVNGTGRSLSVISRIFLAVARSVLIIRFALNGAYIVLLGIVLGVGAIAEGVAKVIDLLTGSDLSSSINKFNQDIVKSIDDRIKAAADVALEFERLSEVSKTLGDVKLGKGIKSQEEIPGSTRRPIPEDIRRRRRGEIEKSLLSASKAVNDAILGFAKDREQAELKFVQDRLKRQQDLIQAQLDNNLISQEVASRKISEIKNKEIDNEIQTRLNAIEFQRSQALLSERDFQEEIGRLRDEEARKEPGKESELSLDSKIEQVTLKQIAERIKVQSELKKLEEEILSLEQNRVDVQKDLLLSQIQVTKELRKQLIDLKNSVADLANPESFEALSAKLSSVVQERFEQIRKLQTSISQISILDFSNLGDDANRALEDRKRLLNELLQLQIREIALRQQAITFDALEAINKRLLNNLQLEQEDIQRRIALGQVSEKEGVVESTAARLRYRDALLKVLDEQRKIAAENPFNTEQKDKVVALQREVEKLGDTITETVLIQANQDARTSLVDFFTKLQQGASNAKSAFIDLGKSILNTFQRLISERLVEELFGSIFGKPGQTQGKATGFFASILRSLGLEPAVKQQQKAEELVKKQGPISTPELDKILASTSTFESVTQRQTNVVLQLATTYQSLDSQVKLLIDSFQKLTLSVDAASTQLPKIDVEETKKSILESISGKPTAGGINKFNEVITGIDSVLKPTVQNLTSVQGATRFSTSKNTAIDSIIDQAARRANIDATLLTELLRQESQFNPNAVGPQTRFGRAIGIGQILPSTARQFGVSETDLKNPNVNINLAAKILKSELDFFKGDVQKALAAYNAGRGNVLKFGGIPPFKETQNYVRSISGKFKSATGLDIQSANKPLTYEQLKRTPLPVNIKKIEEEKISGIGGSGLVKPLGGLSKFTENGVAIVSGSLVGAPESGNVSVQDVQRVGEQFTVTLKNIKTNLETKISGLADVFVEKGQQLRGKQLIGSAGVGALAQGALPTLGNQISEIIKITSLGIKTSIDTGNAIVSQIGLKLDQVNAYLTQLLNLGSVDSTFNPGGIVIPDEGFKYGGKVGFISGGAVKGQGGIRSDSIPAYLSNGEYVIQAPIVKRLGTKFLDRLNRFAHGGPAGKSFFGNTDIDKFIRPFIDETKFDYTGGGADLREAFRPKPIVEQAPKPKKKPGGLRRFFGNIFSFVAPFLNFIPGIGPLLSLGAGALGGALTGADNGVLGAIGGGLFGALGNLGGFGKSGGFLGGLSKFFSGGNGQSILTVLGGLFNNFGGQSGNSLLQILKKLGLFKKKGGIIKLAQGGLSQFFDSTQGLLSLFGIFSSLGSLFGRNNSEPEFIEEELVDPDEARKNKFGTAYNFLTKNGIIPEFKYSEATLEKFRRQADGLRNLIKNPNRSKGGIGGFLKSLFSFLPILLSLTGKKGSLKGIVDSPLKLPGDLGDVFASTGGLIKLAFGGMVRGRGTSMSDSIPSLLSNGEYVIRASAVKSLGIDILDSINEGRYSRMAVGGLAGRGVDTLLPESVGSIPTVNVSNPIEIINLLDPDLLRNYLRTPEGKRQIINVLGENRRTVRETVLRG